VAEMMPAELREEIDHSFEIELVLLFHKISDGRRIQDLRVFLNSVKESMCLCLPIKFEHQEESIAL
jgi:hypothetical protein